MRIALLYEARPEAPSADLPPDIYLEMEALEAIQTFVLEFEKLGHTVRLVNAQNGGLEGLATLRGDVDIVYNYSVGFGTRSREVHAATMCECLALPYTGSDPLTLALASDKHVSKLLARAERIRTPQFRVSRDPDTPIRLPSEWTHCIIKPRYEGSSIGIVGPLDTADVVAVAEEIRRTVTSYSQAVLVEEFISGYEVTVPVLGTDQPRALTPVGLKIGENLHLGMRTFESGLKAESESVTWTTELPFGSRVIQKLRRYATRIHKALGCRDLSRSDFRVSPTGIPYYLETNATPQMTPEGGTFCVAAAAEGMQFSNVLEMVLESAVMRQRIVIPRTTLH